MRRKPKSCERFYRGDASRGTPGVGLGLSLVHAVAKLHGSALELHDNNPGLRVVMSVPIDSSGRHGTGSFGNGPSVERGDCTRDAGLFAVEWVMAVAPDIRRLAALLAPALDILAFCAFLSAGATLRAANAYAFALGYALSLLLRRPALRAAQDAGWPGALRIAIVGFMALFLRAGALALLVQRWGWPPQFGIFFAVALGLAVTAPRWRNPAVALIVYAFVLRLVYAGSVEMMPEETYYWNYSRHLTSATWIILPWWRG